MLAAAATIHLVLASAIADIASPIKKDAFVAVQLLADRAAVVPGETLEVAVWLTPDEGWHVYWRSPGGLTGMPTEIRWTLPDGLIAGRTQFPYPEVKHDPILKEDSFILDGPSLFVTPINVASTVKPGTTVALKAKVSWLACKKECVPGDVELALSLPVVATKGEAKPANKDKFADARRRFPVSADKAEHVTLKGAVDSVKPGDAFNAKLSVAIAAGAHMQSHKPLEDYLIPAVVFVEPTAGLEIGEVKYPEAHIRTDKLLGKLSEYSGDVDFVIPVTVDDDADRAPREIHGVLQYQICNDAGTCYPPVWAEFSIPVQMAGGAKASVQAAEDSPDPVTPIESSATAADASTASAAGDDGWLNRAQNWLIDKGYYGVLAMALIGGLVLNLMPCVLPVISLKVLSFVRQAKEDRGRIFLLGCAYCAGIMVFFGVLAYLYWRSDTGWGELFQRPVVVLILAGVVTAFSLSLFGVFAVFTPQVVNKLGQKAEEQEGVSSAFFTGVLATLLGTACTAPFLSAAVGTASKYPAAQGALIFLAVGVGMALPFLILAANPAWLRFVPRPGPWMGTFEALMGFVLLGTVIWIVNPIRGQLGDWGLLLTLMFLLGVSIAAWVKGKVQFSDPLERKIALHAAALVIVALAWCVPFQWWETIGGLQAAQIEYQRLVDKGKLIELTGGAGESHQVTWSPEAWDSEEIPFVPYDEKVVADFVNAGYTVFVDFTADWCASCKVNLKTSIDTDATRALMRELNVVPFEGDYTNNDPVLKRIFNRHGRASVPMYLVYAPYAPDAPQVLPELLTPSIVADALKKAGPSRSASARLVAGPESSSSARAAPTRR
jgi:thiol:disulfide interchange protein DsbD